MTVMGQHTVDETQDLITVLNGRVYDLTQAYYAIMNDPNALAKDAALAQDWPLWANGWVALQADVKNQLGLLSGAQPMVPNSVMPAEVQYQRLLKGVNSNLPGPYGPKDLMGLQIRIQNLTTIPWQTRPLPCRFDFDLATYQSADSAAKSIEGAGSGLLATVETAAKNNWGKLAIGAGVVVGGAIVAHKLRLL